MENCPSNSKKTRKGLGKTIRFEIFKRDHFTCQYCGAQPPGVVLVIDHIIPVAKGGDNDETNLTTACEPCNQGKKARLLSSVPIRPDADLLYMAHQQEIGEIKRFQKSKQALATQRKKHVEFLQSEWTDISGVDWIPTTAVILKMMATGSLDSVHSAVTATARKVFDGVVNKTTWYKYSWGVFWNAEKSERGEDNG